MPMPITSMNYNQSSIRWEYNIRFSRNILGMESISKAKSMKPFPYKQLRAGVFRPDARHHPAASRLINNINH